MSPNRSSYTAGIELVREWRKLSCCGGVSEFSSYVLNHKHKWFSSLQEFYTSASHFLTLLPTLLTQPTDQESRLREQSLMVSIHALPDLFFLIYPAVFCCWLFPSPPHSASSSVAPIHMHADTLIPQGAPQLRNIASCN